MRITHITPYMHPTAGGPPVVVDCLSRELTNRGHVVRVLTSDLFSNGNFEWTSASERNYQLDIYSAGWPSRFTFSRKFSEGMRLAVQNADIVHIHTLWTYASFGAARACQASKVPYLVMPHGMLDPNSVSRGWLKKQLYGRLLEWPQLRRASGMCYTHPEEERLAEQTYPNLPQGHIVELGCDTPPAADRSQLREEFLQRHPNLRGKTSVLFLGRLHAKKGLDLLIPAFEQVASHIATVRLLLVGPGEASYVNEVRKSVEAHQLGNRVTFIGPLHGRDKWAAMAASELFVLPSYQENFALAAVDAMRSGLPVLLSRRVNLWQDIVAFGAGRVCELTVESVAAEILGALSNSNWRSSAALAGAKLLETRFNWKSTAGRLESIYEQILG
jgi:glycosyltransferase involved in cell wall biosynthesis